MSKLIEAVAFVASWCYKYRKPIGVIATAIVTAVGVETVTLEPVVSPILDLAPGKELENE